MRISIDVSDDLKARITQLSKQRERPAKAIMREAIEQYLDREDIRERFRQEAEVSRAESQEAGQQLIGDETLIWLRAWGTDAETEAWDD